jgi:hypothetical protein
MPSVANSSARGVSMAATLATCTSATYTIPIVAVCQIARRRPTMARMRARKETMPVVEMRAEAITTTWMFRGQSEKRPASSRVQRDDELVFTASPMLK